MSTSTRMTTKERPLALVAPWYRTTPAKARRGTAPVIQKYETSDLVNDFIKDPQHSLKYNDDDFVHVAVPQFSIFPLAKKSNQKSFSTLTYHRTDTRKIFLNTHKRFYLVVCEIHCDEPGFPTARRDEICERGFVVRRRRTVLPPSALRTVTQALQQISVLEVQVNQASDAIQEQLNADLALDPNFGGAVAPKVPFLAGSAAGMARRMVAAAFGQSALSQKEVLQAKLADARGQFKDLTEAVGAQVVLEGWYPSPKGLEHVGAWQTVGEKPDAVAEATFPLYPLIPDPRVKDHAGAGRAIFYGLLPTGGLDHDKFGAARFDDHALYEVRCFARRRKEGSPANCCDGKLAWSEPTEGYQLAPHFDLAGTANHPVTVQMPDLGVLEAQANAKAPPNPFKFKHPQTLNPDSSDKMPSSGSIGGGQICTFSIPLITIVASFVLSLFLPIVVFVFQLFWMLKLKLCIPPSIDASASLTAAIAVKPPQVKLDAHIDLGTSFGTNLDSALKAEFGADAAPKLEDSYSAGALLQLASDTEDNIKEATKEEAAASGPPAAPGGSPIDEGTPLTASLEFETRVQPVA